MPGSPRGSTVHTSSILPDLWGVIEFAPRAFCNLDLDVVLERVVAAARIEREHDWTGTSR